MICKDDREVKLIRYQISNGRDLKSSVDHIKRDFNSQLLISPFKES